MKFLFGGVLLLVSFAASGAVDVENSLSESFSISAYIDARFNQYGGYNAVPSREFSIRRAGIEAEADITGNLKAGIKIEMNPGSIFLKDALVEWEPFSAVQGRFGQFRRAALLGGDISTWNLPLFDRPLVYDLREDLTYSGRDIGADLEITVPEIRGIELTGIAGVFNGDKRGDIREDNELLFSLRGTAEIIPAGIIIGGSAVSHRLGMATSTEPDGYISSARQTAFSGDISVEHDFSSWYSASLYAEYSRGDNWEYAEVIAGQEPPAFSGMWAALTTSYHPWNISSIRKVSLTVGYDELKENTDLDLLQKRISLIGAVYPTENTRFRFGGIRHTADGLYTNDEYTDLILEASLRF